MHSVSVCLCVVRIRPTDWRNVYFFFQGYRDRILQKTELKIPSEEIGGIFSNSEAILNAHETFFKQLDQKIHTNDDPLLGELFLNFVVTNIFNTLLLSFSYSSSLIDRFTHWFIQRKIVWNFMRSMFEIIIAQLCYDQNENKVHLFLNFLRFQL
jgi:hypothetical protein